MSALGQKQTLGKARLMSALPPKADITRGCARDHRYLTVGAAFNGTTFNEADGLSSAIGGGSTSSWDPHFAHNFATWIVNCTPAGSPVGMYWRSASSIRNKAAGSISRPATNRSANVDLAKRSVATCRANSLVRLHLSCLAASLTSWRYWATQFVE